MRDWAHSPVHCLAEAGTYMVTAGTYGKAPLFRSWKRLDFLCEELMAVAERYNWQLQAWAVFPNHYHFVALNELGGNSLRQLIRHLHSVTAREVNRWENTSGRKVWFEYWETLLTYERSFLARLSYVHRNPVHHGLVRVASRYPWCSAGWFERRADRSFFRTVMNFTGKGVKVPDEFAVAPDEVW